MRDSPKLVLMTGESYWVPREPGLGQLYPRSAEAAPNKGAALALENSLPCWLRLHADRRDRLGGRENMAARRSDLPAQLLQMPF